MAASTDHCGHNLQLSALDRESLALLIALRDNAEVQKDHSLVEMFNNSISFLLTSASTLAPPPTVATPLTNSALAPRTVSIVPSIQIDTSGEEGTNGYPGTAVSFVGGRGLNGSEGTDGENARDINLHLKSDDETVAVQWDNGSSSIKLGDASASIFLRAVGGNGGRGGNGGNGKPGANGLPGRDADRCSAGTNGGRGGPGGMGGDGGSGGNGGKGGSVKIYVSPRDTDLLMLLNPPKLTGGARGEGGFKGRGNSGGRGGEGGNPYSWTELRTESRSVSDGRGGMSLESYSYSVYKSNPGGFRGSTGCDGDDGCDGDVGRAGVDGSFQMIVGETPYHTLYDLTITVSKIIDLAKGNPFEIYEPGEHVNLAVSLTNIGGMPTPPQDIDISLCPATWIEQEKASLNLKASEHLPIGSTHSFSLPFSFYVKDQYSPSEEPLNKQETLTYHALLSRVNKSFYRVSQQKDVFTIRYPVQLSPWQGKTSIVFNEKITQSLFIQNITSTSMGELGRQKRRLFVTFEILKDEGMKLSDVELLKIEERDYQEHNKIIAEVDCLAPKGKKSLAVSFRFTKPDLRVQSKVCLVASLYLDYFNSEDKNGLDQTRCIQKRTVQLEFCGTGK